MEYGKLIITLNAGLASHLLGITSRYVRSMYVNCSYLNRSMMLSVRGARQPVFYRNIDINKPSMKRNCRRNVIQQFSRRMIQNPFIKLAGL